MQHYRQWSAAFASYFTFMGLWTAFGPSAMMASNPGAAPLALAAITLAYFVATPFVRVVWNKLGFTTTVVLMGGGVCASLCMAAVMPAWLAWCAPLAFFFGSGSYMLCETRMIDDLARDGQGHEFGRARKWGSFGFLAAAAVGGAVLSIGDVGRSFVLSLAACGVAYLVCCVALAMAITRAKDRTGKPANDRPNSPAAPLQAATPSAVTAQPLRHRITGCAAIATMRLAEAVSTTWFGAYWLSTGHSPLETGLLCALPVAAEFLAMWKGAAFMARYSATTMMLICSVISAVRWLGTPFCSQLWCAVPLQSIHAFTFGFFYPASLLWLKQEFGDGFFRTRYVTESAARALTAAVTFVAAGWIIAAYGYGAVFGVSFVLAVASSLWWYRQVRV